MEEEVIIPAEEAVDPFVGLIPEDPQRFSSSYVTDDYIITIVHDIALGDIIIATLLCVLVVVMILNRVIGGVRR